MIRFSSGERASGILNPAVLEEKMKLTLSEASAVLAETVEHYWTVEWALEEGETYRQYTVPHPSVHLVVVEDMSGVFGVMTRLFSYLLLGRGRVFSVKILPEGFQSVYCKDISRLTDGRFPIAQLFGAAGRHYEATLLREGGSVGEMVASAERFLLSRRPLVDDTARLIGRMVRRIASDRSIARVARFS